MVTATSVGVVAIIAAVAAGIGAIIGQVTIAVKTHSDSNRADRHQRAEDKEPGT